MNDLISRQAALDEIISRLGISGEKYLLESERYIYQIIKDLPPVTPKAEPCEDAISRQAVLDGLASIAKAKAKSDAQKSLMGRVMFFTERLPSVNPQQKTGHWIEERTHMECPNCHDIWHYEENQTERFKFCPTCGYRMIEPQESEDQE